MDKDVSVVAIYTKNDQKYIITFLDFEGNVFYEVVVTDSSSIQDIPAPSRLGFVFVGWDVDFNLI